jgi:hypothetical protein
MPLRPCPRVKFPDAALPPLSSDRFLTISHAVRSLHTPLRPRACKAPDAAKQWDWGREAHLRLCILPQRRHARHLRWELLDSTACKPPPNQGHAASPLQFHACYLWITVFQVTFLQFVGQTKAMHIPPVKFMLVTHGTFTVISTHGNLSLMVISWYIATHGNFMVPCHPW